MKKLEWPERLTLRDTKVIADEGQRIFTTATGYGYEKREYVRADLVAATSADVGEEPVARYRKLERELSNTKNTDLRADIKDDIIGLSAELATALAAAEAKLAEARKVIERYWKGAYWAAMTDQDADVVNAFLEETK